MKGLEAKRKHINPEHPKLSIRRQCKILNINRSSLYYKPKAAHPLNFKLMKDGYNLYSDASRIYVFDSYY